MRSLYCHFGAGDEARTRYLHLGKVALYRMSYTRISVPKREPWCLRSESNQRHVDFQSTALPTELQRHIVESLSSPQMHYMATRNGLEPSTSSVTGWRANRLHHRAKFGGNNRARTCDPMLVRHVLFQLSYAPLPFRFSFCCSPQRHDTLYTAHLVLSSTFFEFFQKTISSAIQWFLPQKAKTAEHFIWEPAFFRRFP